MTIKIAIAGAAGRMGQQLIAATKADDRAELRGAFDRKADDFIDDSMTRAFQGAHVVIDFTLPTATAPILQAVKSAGAAYVLGTTGHDADQSAAIEAAAKDMPILWAANFSLGVNLLLSLVQKAAAALPAETFDLDIWELHHGKKVDAPSGTALALGRAAAAGRNIDLSPIQRLSREGDMGARMRGEIGFAATRGGDNPGEHTVYLLGEGERLELTHRALDRSIFAKGAVSAACWLKGKPVGLYGMSDVLGL